MLTRSVICTGVAVLLCICTRADGQPADLDGLLSMKPAPGVEALLAAHATDGRVGRRWRALLGHADPPIRLTVARALGVTKVRSAGPDLLRALASEQDLDVVGELVQALAIVGSDVDLLQVYTHLHRIRDADAIQLLDGLAAARPDVAALHVVSVEPLRARSEWVHALYQRLAQTQPVAADRVDASVAASLDPVLIEGVIRGAADARRRLPAALVQAGLRLPSGGQSATLGYLAAVYATPQDVIADTTLKGAAIEADTASDSPEARWVASLRRRWFNRDDSTDLVSLFPALVDIAWIRDTPRPVLAVLTAPERVAFATHFQLSAAAAAALLDLSVGTPAPEAPTPVVTVLSDLPAVVLEDVERLTRCEAQASDERFASVRYHPDRRPAAIAIEPTPWSPGCERAARAAITLAYGTPPRADADRTLVLIRLDSEFAACLADRQPRTAAATETGGGPGWTVPRKLYDRRPAYPEVAVKSRLQGLVRVEARIERGGCVSDARVVQSVHPLLDTAALQAVSRWRYGPTTLNGVPVALVMTVEVDYSLR